MGLKEVKMEEEEEREGMVHVKNLIRHRLALSSRLLELFPEQRNRRIKYDSPPRPIKNRL
jgi:hypothetical protein